MAVRHVLTELTEQTEAVHKSNGYILKANICAILKQGSELETAYVTGLNDTALQQSCLGILP